MLGRLAGALGAGVCVMAVAVAAPAPAFAQQVMAYDINAGGLKSALDAFARQSGRQVIYRMDDVRGARSPGVRGPMAADAALRAILAGTGFSSRADSTGAIAIVRISNEGAAAPGEAEAGSAAADSGSAEEIVVTGTNIRGNGPVGFRPVTISRADIEASGRNTAADVLRRLPQVTSLGSGGEARSGVQSGALNVSFADGINLRGIGTDATLTLLNGHRVAQSNEGGVVDTSQIPLLGIERIEVLANGASSIYGSDAVAGVVNFVLRSNYDGVDAFSNISLGDGFTQRTVGFDFGKRWNGGSFFIAFDYFHQSNLVAVDRFYYTNDLRPFGGPDLRTNNGIPGTITAGGVTYAIPVVPPGTRVLSSQLIPGTSNRRDRWEDSDILPSTDRLAGVLTFRQDLSETVSFFLDGILSLRGSTRRNNSSELTLTVPRANPWFVNPNPNAQTTTVLYNVGSLYGSGASANKITAEDVTGHGGLSISLPRSWSADLSVLGSSSLVNQFVNTATDTARLNEALADPNPATAFNPFGDNPPSVADRVRRTLVLNRRVGMYSLNLNLSGPLFQIGDADPVQLAIGGELRKERLRGFDTSTALAVQTAPIALSRRIGAVYAEISAPIVARANALPLIHSLTLSAAIRGESYSDFGTAWNPRFGVDWELTPSVQFSGSWGRSFKTPRLPQMVTASNSIITQPLGLQSGPVTVISISGNQPGLRPERAETWSFGMTYRPPWLRSLTARASFFHIDYRNRIIRPTVGEIIPLLSGGVDSPVIISRSPSAAEVLSYYNDPRFSPASAKPAPNTIFAVIDTTFANIGSLSQSGVDISFDLSMNSPIGDFRLRADAAYLFNYDVTRVEGGPKIALLNTVNNPLDLRARAGVEWTREGWRAALFANHVGNYLNTTITPNQPISSWTTVDANVGYSFRPGPLSGLRLGLDVRNALDADPPAVAHVSGQLGYDAEQANALGRMIALTLEARW